MINFKTIFILSFFVALGIWILPKSSLVKDANREFADGEKDFYLHNVDQKRKCYLTDRFSSTVRRSDSINNVKKNRCYFSKTGEILISLKKRSATFLIPSKEGVNLYINRVFKGKYQKYNFTKKNWDKNGVISLLINDDLMVFNHRFRPEERVEYLKDLKPITDFDDVSSRLRSIDFRDYKVKNYFSLLERRK